MEINEHFLRRTSAELHDGPAQAIGFALLRLDAIDNFLDGCQHIRAKGACPKADALAVHDLGTIRHALKEALGEIRDVSSGLALPQLDELTLVQVLQRATRAHMHRTGTDVKLKVDKMPEWLPLSYKIGIYRFVQEALNNAFRHAGGLRQQVRARHDNNVLQIEVSDAGPGFQLEDTTAEM
ncbi:MAG: sensor histidine kinase, partial [Burkholderiales bacterium]|nr:sensor histidine kinase [Burkholderiales bacterium]